MKYNRIVALAVAALAVVIVLSQAVGVGAQAGSGDQQAQVGRQQAAAASNVQVSAAPVKQGKAGPQVVTSVAPYKLAVQGRLTNAVGAPIVVATNVTFNLYSVATAGAAFFTEGPVSVTPDANGLFTYQLGTASPIDNNIVDTYLRNTAYLGITVGADTEMTPRFLLTGSPYAMGLAAGSAAVGAVEQSSIFYYGTINGVNVTTDTDRYNSGVYGRGNFGLYGRSNGGAGVYGSSIDSNANQQSVGVSGESFGTNGFGGTFTGTIGVQGRGATAGGYGGYFIGGTDSSSYAGVRAFGASGIWASSTATGSSNSFGGYFDATSSNTGFTTAVYGVASKGYGVYGLSFGSTATQGSYGVVGNAIGDNSSTTVAGVFTSTGTGLVVTATRASVFGKPTNPAGVSYANDGIDVYHTNSDGLYVINNNAVPANIRGLSTNGRVLAANVTAANYAMELQYHGSETLQAGDVLALDGDNKLIEGNNVLGAVKATAENAGAAIGVIEHRLSKQGLEAGKLGWNVDPTGSIKSGDMVSVIVLGQAQMKVGNAAIGDRLTIGANGLTVSKDASAFTIGKVASKPDASGNTTVFVNFK